MPYCPRCGTKHNNESDICANCGASLYEGTGRLNPKTVLVGCYIIMRTLGRGGMGVIYLAHDTTLRMPRPGILNLD